MAFDFEESKEIGLTKNLEDSVEVDLNHTGIEKIVAVDCGIGIKGSGKSTSLADLQYNTVITTSCGSKLLPVDECVTSYRRSITDLPPALISEIFNCLESKELGLVSCVSVLLFRIASEHHVWKEFYCDRWGLLVVPTYLGAGCSDEKSWKELFVEREFRSKMFMAHYSVDVLYGHTEAVRTVFVLPSKKLMFSSGNDSIIRMWDMEEGLSMAFVIYF